MSAKKKAPEPADSRRKRRNARKEQGFCIYCGLNPPKEKAKGCAKCSEILARRQRAYIRSKPESNKAYRQRLRKEVIEHYGGKCSCCAETELVFLTMDHVGQDGAEDRLRFGSSVSSYQFYLSIRRDGFPKTLRVLCWNCNFATWHLGVCPHESKQKEDTRELP